MKFLLIGSGAREHAIAWKLSQSSVVKKILLWPGNPAMKSLGEFLDFPKNVEFNVVAKFAKEEHVDAVISGPETPLAQGLADILEEYGVKCFGPKKKAAMLESSKLFAKEIMKQANIPTADYTVVTNRDDCKSKAFKHFKQKGSVVLKANGLCSGKGVFVCKTEDDLNNAIKTLYSPKMLDASFEVLVEETMLGRECSYFAFIGEGGIFPIGFAVDFKRLKEKDKGPNTGGMGCYSPVPWLPDDASKTIEKKIIYPLLTALEEQGINYCGCLYLGLMWTSEGPKIIEFNVRLGDPEAQVLAACDNKDWGSIIARSLRLTTPSFDIEENPSLDCKDHDVAVGVVMASSDYPFLDSSRIEESEIPWSLFKENSKRIIFAASVKDKNNILFTSKGRVLTVIGKGQNFKQAQKNAYHQVNEISKFWSSAYWRKDIAQRLIEEGY